MTVQTVEAFIEVNLEAWGNLISSQIAEITDFGSTKVTSDKKLVILAVFSVKNAAVVTDRAPLFVGSKVNRISYRVSVVLNHYHRKQHICRLLRSPKTNHAAATFSYSNCYSVFSPVFTITL